jgi:hypothetical protein
MVEKRFHMLRFVAGLFRLGGFMILILGALVAVAGAVAAMALGSNLMAYVCWYPDCALVGEPAGSLLVVLFGFLMVIALFIVLFAAGDLLALLISMEENTRRTAVVLRTALAAPAPPARPVVPVPEVQPQPQVPQEQPQVSQVQPQAQAEPQAPALAPQAEPTETPTP